MTRAFLFYFICIALFTRLLQNRVYACIFLTFAINSQSDFTSKEVQCRLDRRWRCNGEKAYNVTYLPTYIH